MGDELGHRGEVLVDVVHQLLGAVLIQVGDVDLAGAVVGQHGADGPAGAAAAEAEEDGLIHLHAALLGDGGVEPDAVGVIADQLALGGLDHGVAGAHLLAQGVQLVQVLQHLHLVGLGHGEAGEVHVPDAVDDVGQMLVIGLGVEVDHVQTGGLVPGVLHPGGEGLPQRGADQGDHFGVDVNLHNSDLISPFQVFGKTAGAFYWTRGDR